MLRTAQVLPESLRACATLPSWETPDFISGRFPPRTLLLSFLDAFPWKQSVRDWDADLFHCSSSAQAHDVRIPPSWAFRFAARRLGKSTNQSPFHDTCDIPDSPSLGVTEFQP